MHKILKGLLLGICIFCYQASEAQHTGIIARVIDRSSKMPVKEALITKRDSSLSVRTNYLGYFQITALPDDTLWISHDDYGKVVIIVPHEPKFTIALVKKESEEDKVYSSDEVDKIPKMQLSNDELLAKLASSLVYPKEAQRKGVGGKVYLYFIIDETGEVIESGIEKGIGYGCDEAALEVFRKMKTKWFPGIKNQKKVKVRMVVPINFVIDN